jgi:hypothetical protein
VSLSHKAAVSPPLPPTSIWGAWGAPFSARNPSGASARSLWTHGALKVGPRAAQGAKREPKRSLLGAQRVTLGGKIAESGPLREPQYLLCFNHIMRVRAPPFSRLKSPWERNGHQERSFSHILVQTGRQWGAQGGQRVQKESQSLPGDA